MDHCHKSIVCLNHFIPIQRPIIINCSNLTIRPDAMSIVSEFGMLNLLVIALSKMFPYLYERYVAQYSPIPYINLNCYDLLFIGWLLLLMHYNRSYAAPYRDIALCYCITCWISQFVFCCCRKTRTSCIYYSHTEQQQAGEKWKKKLRIGFVFNRIWYKYDFNKIITRQCEMSWRFLVRSFRFGSNCIFV